MKPHRQANLIRQVSDGCFQHQRPVPFPIALGEILLIPELQSFAQQIGDGILCCVGC